MSGPGPTLVEWLMLAAGLCVLARGVRLAAGLLRIPRLAEVVPQPRGPLPTVTICCAGRDEGPHLERAIRSWLAQDVPGLEIVFVDDRSADETPEVLARLAAEDARLLPLRVDERPDGWLGKCWALHVAARHATGEFVLFTDADVRLEPGALARALAACRDHAVDHLAVLPVTETSGPVEEAFTRRFFHLFLGVTPILRANADRGGFAIGVGAFNLVRRSLYERAGGHEPVRMQVGDDVALGRLLLHAGGRHRTWGGEGLVRLRWYHGVRATIRGLEKNAFWGSRFSLVLVAGFTLSEALLLAPLAAPFVATPAAWAALTAWVTGTALPYLAPRPFRPYPAGVPLDPLSTLLLAATLWNSAIRTLRRGGIAWRGDVFPLAVLRAHQLPLSWWTKGPR